MDRFAQMHNDWLDPDRHLQSEGGSAEFDIDLKWSLWSQDEGTWEQYAPEALKHLRMMSDNTLVLKTAPRKEIRFGTVTITGTAEAEAGSGGELEATGRFEAHWDSVEDLMDTLDVAASEDADYDEQYQCLVESLPFANMDGDPGTYVEFEVKATTVAELLRLVDEQEAKLLAEDEQAWKELEDCYRTLKQEGKGVEDDTKHE
jgi:hypothetical protein